jgi:hypothetical protein
VHADLVNARAEFLLQKFSVGIVEKIRLHENLERAS